MSNNNMNRSGNTTSSENGSYDSSDSKNRTTNSRNSSKIRATILPKTKQMIAIIRKSKRRDTAKAVSLFCVCMHILL